jgi:hypothetical protein
MSFAINFWTKDNQEARPFVADSHNFGFSPVRIAVSATAEAISLSSIILFKNKKMPLRGTDPCAFNF